MGYQSGKVTNRRPIITFFYLFIGWFALAQVLLWVLKTHTSLVSQMQDTLAWVAGALYGLSGESVFVMENILLSQTSEQYVYIDLPCLGLDMCAGLIALQLAMRSTWSRRLIAICCGLLLLQLYNSVRIAHLFSIAGMDIEQFKFYHLFVWQSINLIVLLSLNIGLAVLFHHDSLITKSLRNSRLIRTFAQITLFAPLLFIERAFGGGGGGGGGGSSVPFIEFEFWQFGLFVALLFVFIKYAHRDTTCASGYVQ